eukprot:2510434-Amphidinium_carterae.1
MYHINGDGLQHGKVRTTHWDIPRYFTIKCAFKLLRSRPHTSRTEFSYAHSIEQYIVTTSEFYDPEHMKDYLSDAAIQQRRPRQQKHRESLDD